MHGQSRDRMVQDKRTDSIQFYAWSLDMLEAMQNYALGAYGSA